ncbi:MAG: hypothetical protein AAF800_10035 [Planctomycetota bacterium]
MDWRVILEQDPRLGGAYRRIAGRPSWPLRAALLCGAAVVVVPVVLALFAGLAVGGVVYLVGSAVAGLGETFGGGRGRSTHDRPTPGDELRENVRVVHR